MDIRIRNSIWSVRGSELPIVPFGSQGQHNLRRGKGQCFHRFPKEGRIGDCVMLETPEIRELQRKLYRKAKQEPKRSRLRLRKLLEEDDRKAVFGKTECTV